MTKALAKRPIDKLKKLISEKSIQDQFKNAMGKHSDLFVASLIDVFNDNLSECEPGAVIQEALKAAVLKLPISKGLGFAYLVPYKQSYQVGGQWKKKKVPQFQVGYKGMIQLAMRSGQLKILNADVVYDGELGGVNRLTGMFELSGEKKSNEVVGYFVYMELINGFQKAEYWTKEAIIDHAEKFSKSYQSDIKYKSKKSAWFTDPHAMGKKTVLRSVLGKYAPMSVEFIAAMTMDNESSTMNEPLDITDEAVEAKPESSLAAAMKNGEKKEKPPQEAKPEESDKCRAVQDLIKLRDDPAYKTAIAVAIKQEMFDQHEMDSAIFNDKEKSAQAIIEAIKIQQND